jgi:6-carboxyhexanoate--CoA ligase
MNEDVVYSVRMRAAAGGPHERGGRHVSGAERIVEAGDVDEAVAALMRRARNRAIEPDFVQVIVEHIQRSTIAQTPILRLRMTPPRSCAEAIDDAKSVLRETGISVAAIDAAFQCLREGADPTGGSIRGAVLMDAASGQNLTPDPNRGVRASRFDYAPADVDAIDNALGAAGLSHFRTREALALATKVIWSGVRAELCWSDDREYVAGYVATPRDGYIRYADFKPSGAAGGRVFFIDASADIEEIVDRLERRALWITGPFSITSIQG